MFPVYCRLGAQIVASDISRSLKYSALRCSNTSLCRLATCPGLNHSIDIGAPQILEESGTRADS